MVIRTNARHRQNPAVLNNAAQIFDHVLRALESDAIQGQTAERVVTATKSLIAAAGLNIQQLATQLAPERVYAVQKYFA